MSLKKHNINKNYYFFNKIAANFINYKIQKMRH